MSGIGQVKGVARTTSPYDDVGGGEYEMKFSREIVNTEPGITAKKLFDNVHHRIKIMFDPLEAGLGMPHREAVYDWRPVVPGSICRKDKCFTPWRGKMNW